MWVAGSLSQDLKFKLSGLHSEILIWREEGALDDNIMMVMMRDKFHTVALVGWGLTM